MHRRNVACLGIVSVAGVLANATVSSAREPTLKETQDWIVQTLLSFPKELEESKHAQFSQHYDRPRFDQPCEFRLDQRLVTRYYSGRPDKAHGTETWAVPIMDIEKVSIYDTVQKFKRIAIATKNQSKTIRKEADACSANCRASVVNVGAGHEDQFRSWPNIDERLTKAFRHLQTLLADRCKGAVTQRKQLF